MSPIIVSFLLGVSLYSTEDDAEVARVALAYERLTFPRGGKIVPASSVSFEEEGN